MHARSDDPTKRRALGVSEWRLLLFWEGGRQSHVVRPDARMVLGRGDDCDIRVPHESVSRQHAVLTGGDAGWQIEDLESLNGTFVSGTRLGKGAPGRVDPGTVVML